MAKNLVTVESVIESTVITGLEHCEAAQSAFVQYVKSEYGTIEGDSTGLFAGISLSGKGDKAKGKLDKGTVEFKGGHNTALRVLAGASAILKLENSINCVVGKLDASEVCQLWFEKWAEKHPEVREVFAKA